MDKRRKTANKRNQPSRQTRAQAGGMEDVLLDVLQELKTLKEEVKEIKERQGAIEGSQENQGTSSTSATLQPSNSEARTPGGTNESGSGPTNLSPTVQGPSSSLAWSSHTAPSLPQVTQLSSSLPLVAQVPSSSLPLVDIVPEQMRQDIIRGKDINLVQLLMPTRERGNFVSERVIKIGEESLHLKALSDKRLTKLLTVQEFVSAFNIYKNILCEAFPGRRGELDRYMSSIIHIGSKYPGFAHYEYHLEFSARAAYFKEHRNILVDWGVVDDRLLTQIVAGRRANTCTLCGGFDHATSLCGLAIEGRKAQSITNTRKPCDFYNSRRGCKKEPGQCQYSHVCSFCRSATHVVENCIRKKQAIPSA